MKKRIIAVILTVTMVVSMISVLSISSTAETDMGKSTKALKNEIGSFIKIAETQVPRDDYADPKNSDLGLSKHPETTKLENLIAEAKAVRSKGDKEMNDFLVKLFGGWAEKKDDDGVSLGKMDYVDDNKPYSAFQNSLLIRWVGIDAAIYDVDHAEKPYSALKREDYTIESWEPLKKIIKKIERYVDVTTEYPISHLAVATRCEMYRHLLTYNAAYDALVPFNGDKEINKYKGFLSDTLFDTWSKNEFRPDGWSFEELYATSDEDPNAPALIALKELIDKAKATFQNSNATLEEVQSFLDITPLFILAKTGETISQAKIDEKPELYKEKDFVQDTVTGKRTITYNYPAKIEGAIQDFRNSIFVGKNYFTEKNKIYLKAYNEYINGRYSEDDWSTYIKCFEKGDAIAKSYKTKASELRACIKDQIAAYGILKSKEVTTPQHILTFKQIEEWMAKTDLTIYTTATLEIFKNAINTYKDLRDNGASDEELNKWAIYICTAKDRLIIEEVADPDKPTPDQPTSDLGATIEQITNHAVLMLTRTTEMMTEYSLLMEENSYAENVIDAFAELQLAVDTLKGLVDEGLAQVEAYKKDPKFTFQITTEQLLTAILDMYTLHTELTYCFASAPITAND